jgi:putative Ca2+/H+ antiporter (TMEM165/GDT1 family)
VVDSSVLKEAGSFWTVILFATLANHAAAGLAGTFFGSLLSGPWMRWILGISFLSVAVWAPFPDKYEGDDKAMSRAGAFLSTLCAFFTAEMVTRRRSPRSAWPRGSRSFYPVVIGTTLGMIVLSRMWELVDNALWTSTATEINGIKLLFNIAQPWTVNDAKGFIALALAQLRI